MKLTKVNSSAIEAIGYEPDTGTLGILFKRDGEYHYKTPVSTYVDLCKAKSIGEFFNSKIRNHYTGRKVS